MLFDFESDFAGSLRCIPMIVRMKLDLCGIKLTLRQWSRFTREDRVALTDLACSTLSERETYRTRVLALIEAHSEEPVRFLPEETHDDWQRSDRMPDAVMLQAQADLIAPPTAAQWASLLPLQRFALIKLARSKHENENFVPAMKEFGLCRARTDAS